MGTERMLSRKAYAARKDRLIKKDRIKRLLADNLTKHPDLIKYFVPRPPPEPALPSLHSVPVMLEALAFRQTSLTYAEYFALRDLLAELQWYRDNCACD